MGDSDRKPEKDDEPSSPISDASQGNKEPSGASGLLSGLMAKLNMGSSGAAGATGDQGKMKILDEASLSGVKKYIQSGQCKNVIVMAGAGISTAAGIPDFRSPGSGIYDNVIKKYGLSDPQMIFEIGYFRQNPKPFFTLSKELFPASFEPTLSHYFVRLLHEEGLLLRHYTQNIDGLERKAGIPDEKIVEAHGSFYTSHCLSRDCHEEYSFDWMKEKIMSDEVAKCDKCNSLVKPDIVFFGEALPIKFFQCAQEDFDKCDLLIIMGTSLVVQPFASLVERVSDNCPRLLINREKVGEQNSSYIAALIEKYAGKVGADLDLSDLLGSSKHLNFDDKRNRDVAILGDCDDGCKQLAKTLGWAEKLQSQVSKTVKPKQ